MNYFIEGLQGSGKSTMVGKLSETKGGRVYREGDYSPVELAWCAYLTEDEYAAVLDKFADLRPEIEAQTFPEGGKKIVCYTRVKNGTEGFYKELESHEIYNGRIPLERFTELVLGRYARWGVCTSGACADGIFECSLFQNTVEDMTLFRDMTDEEIIAFYRRVRDVLAGKKFRIVYLKADDIAANLAVIRKERSDEQGNELWFPLMCEYFDNSPYAKARGVSGEKALIEHFEHRQELELRICREIFPDEAVILPSKGFTDADVAGL